MPALGHFTLVLASALVATTGDDPKPGAAEAGPLAATFAALGEHFEVRVKQYDDERSAAEHLDAKARAAKIAKAEADFQAFWHPKAREVEALIHANPDDPAVFDGILFLPGTMRTVPDEAILRIARRYIRIDPRAGRLCYYLDYVDDDVIRGLIEEARKHPLLDVRGQATFALATLNRYAADGERPAEVRAQARAESARLFAEVAEEFADVPSADGKGPLGPRARAQLARLRNLPDLKVGRAAPEIAGLDLDGRPLKLSDHRGKVVVIVFWAASFDLSMAMVPHGRELVKRLEGRPFLLLGVNSDWPDDREKAKAAAAEMGMIWPSWWDGHRRGLIHTAYDVKQWPTVYVIDASGTIRALNVRGHDLDEAVDELLAEMESAAKKDKP